MAKAVALIASALFVLALAGFAQSQEETFTVQGKVYCDTCRVLFLTRISKYLSGAQVELKCRGRDNGTETYNVAGTTGADGSYALTVKGNHDDEICEVVVVSSPIPECSEIMSEIDSARITLSDNSGIKTMVRYANPIGFVQKESLAECKEVLDQMGFVPIPIDG